MKGWSFGAQTFLRSSAASQEASLRGTRTTSSKARVVCIKAERSQSLERQLPLEGDLGHVPVAASSIPETHQPAAGVLANDANDANDAGVRLAKGRNVRGNLSLKHKTHISWETKEKE